MGKKLVILAVIIMITLSSCMPASRFLELALCGSYAVPGMYAGDLKGSPSPDILEEDSQGRILFLFTHPNSITGENDTALVICQHIDNQYVYYYEDQCYLLNCDSEEDIAWLKSQNDWGSALNFDKMSVRPNSISFDLFIVPDRVLEWNDVRKAIAVGLANLRTTPIESCLLDINPMGYELYWVTAVADGVRVSYYAIISTDYDVSFMPAEQAAVVPKEISVFKSESGWYSTNGT